MNIKQLDEKLSIGPQILPHQIEEFAKLGYKSIICNRPDGESADQPNFSEIADAAQKHGLTAEYLPVSTPMVPQSVADQFSELLEKVDGAVYAYCRSGMRSNALWSKSQGGAGAGALQALMGMLRR